LKLWHDLLTEEDEAVGSFGLEERREQEIGVEEAALWVEGS
jgi:hypothetical protein